MPTADGSVPPEPDWQSIYADVLDIAAAHEEWTVVLHEMQDAGTLALCNGHALRRLVEFRIQYERLSRHVAEMGPIVKVRRQATYSPYWIAMRQADDSIRVLEDKLGISPYGRGKAGKVGRAKTTPRAADKYLKLVKR